MSSVAPARPRAGRLFPILLFAGTFLVVLAGMSALFLRPLLSRRAGPELPRIGQVPSFALTSHEGETVTQRDLAGRVWVADFVFLRCGSTCPVMTSAMAGLERSLADVPEVRFVSFSVDPDHDGVAELAAFAKANGAAAPRWTFLHGKDRATIGKISREGFRLGLDEGGPDDPEPILHSTRFVLVDATGAIRGTYDGTDAAEVQALARDVRRLAAAS